MDTPNNRVCFVDVNGLNKYVELNIDFDQQTACGAPDCRLKYTTHAKTNHSISICINISTMENVLL